MGGREETQAGCSGRTTCGFSAAALEEERGGRARPCRGNQQNARTGERREAGLQVGGRVALSQGALTWQDRP